MPIGFFGDPKYLFNTFKNFWEKARGFHQNQVHGVKKVKKFYYALNDYTYETSIKHKVLTCLNSDLNKPTGFKNGSTGHEFSNTFKGIYLFKASN